MWTAVLSSVVFYIPVFWAIISLFKQDDLDVFYILLLISFALGVRHHRKMSTANDKDERDYPFDLD